MSAIIFVEIFEGRAAVRILDEVGPIGAPSAVGRLPDDEAQTAIAKINRSTEG